MRTWPWIPPWIPVKSWLCARYDCNELRHQEDNGVVRRWCKQHCEEYEREASEVSTEQKFLRPGFSGERAGVPGATEERGRTGGTVQTDRRGDGRNKSRHRRKKD